MFESTYKDDGIQRYLLHTDDTSWGLYAFPLSALEVPANPYRIALTESGSFRNARDSDDYVRIHGPPLALRGQLRVLSGTEPICSWYRTGLDAAPLLLFQALPSFWLSRFRFVGPAKELKYPGISKIDISSFIEKRQGQRESLIRHGDSLGQKAWSIRHHRGQLIAALGAVASSSNDLYQMILAGAEYAALGHAMYSFLEEMADVLALMRTIQGLPATPSSFHDLHKARAAQDPQLADILDAATWYEPFRLERAGNAHAFATLVRPDARTDIQLWQQPHHRVNNGKAQPVREADSHVREVTEGFDRCVAHLAQYLLGMFHPFDVVTFAQAPPNRPKEHTRQRAWVREISFSEEPPYRTTGWAIIATDGTLRIATNERGALVSPTDAAELPQSDSTPR